MTRGKLLENNPTLFIFISILMMTQETRKQTTEPILGTPILGMAILGTAFPWCVRLSCNVLGFVSVDLIGEYNQVILEYKMIHARTLLHKEYTSTVDIHWSHEITSETRCSEGVGVTRLSKRIRHDCLDT